MDGRLSVGVIDPVIRQGVLKKRNEWRMWQARRFVLMRDHTIAYFKDEVVQKGTILLERNTRIARTSKE